MTKNYSHLLFLVVASILLLQQLFLRHLLEGTKVVDPLHGSEPMPLDPLPTYEPGTDEELVARCQRELPAITGSFELLMHRYARYIYRHVYHLVRNHQEAEDITQEIFLKVYTHIATFEQRAAFSTWLYRIMTNCVLDAQRKRKRHDAMMALTSWYERQWGDEKPSLSRCSPPVETGESLVQVEVREAITTTFQALQPQQAHLLLLRDYYGWSYYELAQRYGWSLSGTKMRLLRARQAFRSTYPDRSLLGAEQVLAAEFP